MVGETQARPFAQNTVELINLFKERQNTIRKKINDNQKMIIELERELAEYKGKENILDSVIFEIEHMGEHSGPKKRKIRESEKEEAENLENSKSFQVFIEGEKEIKNTMDNGEKVA